MAFGFISSSILKFDIRSDVDLKMRGKDLSKMSQMHRLWSIFTLDALKLSTYAD